MSMGTYTGERTARSIGRAYKRIVRARSDRRCLNHRFRADYDSAQRWSLIWNALLDRWNASRGDPST